jgi:hypothetical protein
MINIKAIVFFVLGWLNILAEFAKTTFLSSVEKDLEILALRSQLSILQQNIINNKLPKPRFTSVFRLL